jgi:predicted HTH transcriptional regulator
VEDGTSAVWKGIARPEWRSLFLIVQDGDEECDALVPFDPSVLSPEPGDPLSEEEVARYIDDGESDDVEFKSWKKLEGNGKDKDTILHSVIAFGNAVGGVLLVGVNNEGEADGPEVALVEEQELHNRAERLSRRFREKAEPTVPVRIQLIRYAGGYLFAISVQEVQRKPCMSRGGAVYIRAGSESRPARLELE